MPEGSPQQYDAIQKHSSHNLEALEVFSSPKGLGFKKVITCLMPYYPNMRLEEYIARFRKALKDIFSKGKSFIFIFNQTSECNTLPNQLLVSLLLEFLASESSLKVSKIQLVSPEKKICDLFRLEAYKSNYTMS